MKKGRPILTAVASRAQNLKTKGLLGALGVAAAKGIDFSSAC
jgi:hypothetical protein